MVHFNPHNSLSSLTPKLAPKRDTPQTQPPQVKDKLRQPPVENKPMAQDTVTLSRTATDAASVESTQAVSASDSARNPFANTILTFIDAQLRRDVADGATATQLQSRLMAGYEGFMQGFNDAFQQLEDMGQLTDDVKAEINQTKFQVLKGINDLAKELGLAPVIDELAVEPPTKAEPQAVPSAQNLPPALAPTSSQVDELLKNAFTSEQKNQLKLIESLKQTIKRSDDTYAHLGKVKNPNGAAQSVSNASGRYFDLTVKTQDGDLVTLKVNAKNISLLKMGADGNLANANHQGFNFEFEVNGELDAGELNAINALLADTQHLANTFFNGDLDQAFAEAKNIGMDESELAGFALNLIRIDTNTVSQSQQQPSSPALVDAVQTTGLQQYAKQVLANAQEAQAHGLGLDQLLEFFSQLEQFQQKLGLHDFAKGVFDHSKNDKALGESD